MRAVVAGLCFCVLAASARADALTCGSFRSLLAQAIRNGEDTPALPRNLPLAFVPDGGDGLHFAVSGAAGIKGDLSCDQNDVFQSFDIHSDNAGADDKEIASRILRLLALSAAATCVTDPAPTSACNGRVNTFFLAAYDSFDRARARGDQPPGSSQSLDISPDSRAELSLVPDGAFFTLRTRQR